MHGDARHSDEHGVVPSGRYCNMHPAIANSSEAAPSGAAGQGHAHHTAHQLCGEAPRLMGAPSLAGAPAATGETPRPNGDPGERYRPAADGEMPAALSPHWTDQPVVAERGKCRMHCPPHYGPKGYH